MKPNRFLGDDSEGSAWTNAFSSGGETPARAFSDDSDHPRGQPDNAGQFVKKGEGGKSGDEPAKKTAVKRGKFTTVPTSKLDFPGGLSKEVAPLNENKNKPIIVRKLDNGKYRIIDGFGRASGLSNAGNNSAHVIVVTDADIAKNTSGQGDDPEWVAAMHHKYAPHSSMAVSPEDWNRDEQDREDAAKEGKAREETEKHEAEEKANRDTVKPLEEYSGMELIKEMRKLGLSGVLPWKDEQKLVQWDDPEQKEKARKLIEEKRGIVAFSDTPPEPQPEPPDASASLLEIAYPVLLALKAAGADDDADDLAELMADPARADDLAELLSDDGDVDAEFSSLFAEDAEGHEHGKDGKFTGKTRTAGGKESHYVNGRKVADGDHEGKAKAEAAAGGGFGELKHGGESLVHKAAVSTKASIGNALTGVRAGKIDLPTARASIDAAANHATAAIRNGFERRAAVLRADVAHRYGEDALDTPEWEAVESHIQATRDEMQDAADSMTGYGHDALDSTQKGDATRASGQKDYAMQWADTFADAANKFMGNLVPLIQKFKAEHSGKKTFSDAGDLDFAAYFSDTQTFASAHQDGQTWNTGKFHFKREGGKTRRIADPNRKDEPKKERTGPTPQERAKSLKEGREPARQAAREAYAKAKEPHEMTRGERSQAANESVKDTRPTRTISAKTISPINETTPEYVRELSDSMKKNGWVGPPLLVVEKPNGKYDALTGSHRSEAAELAGVEVPVYVLDMKKYQQSAKKAGVPAGHKESGDEEKIAAIAAYGDPVADRLMRREHDSRADYHFQNVGAAISSGKNVPENVKQEYIADLVENNLAGAGYSVPHQIRAEYDTARDLAAKHGTPAPKAAPAAEAPVKEPAAKPQPSEPATPAGKPSVTEAALPRETPELSAHLKSLIAASDADHNAVDDATMAGIVSHLKSLPKAQQKAVAEVALGYPVKNAKDGLERIEGKLVGVRKMIQRQNV